MRTTPLTEDATTSSPSRDAGSRAVAQAVRSGDRDRYWSALFASPAARADLLALYAFNAEIARIPYLVSEPMVGQIRLQWWRDAIDLASAETRTGNPVADALGLAIRRHDLPKERLQAMVDARLFDLYTEPVSGIPAFKVYVQETAGALFALSCKVLGGSGPEVESASDAAGLAYGITALLRALPLHAASGRLFLPLTALQSADGARGVAGPDRDTPELRRELNDLDEAARHHLARFREQAASLPPALRPAFLILALVEPLLDRMSAPGHRPLQDVADLSPLYRLWRLWKAALSGTI